MFASKDLFFTRPSGYQISRSVRLRSSATAYFNRTPASATNQKTLTLSAWVKRGALGVDATILGTADSTSSGYNLSLLRFTSTDVLRFITTNNVGASVLQFDTTAVFRDPSAWYHIVLYVDTTQATNTNGIRIYVNGVNQAGTYAAYTQNTNTFYNSTIAQYMGRWGSISPSNYFDGYLTEVNFIDGQALTPSSFGQTNTVTGVWQPLKYTGTYGTNGFYLNFSDNSAATAAAIGKDYSGNGNNWTPNNISVTAGTTYDSMLDVPTLFADGGNGRGNYAVLNPVSGYSVTLTNGNLTYTTGTSSNPVTSTWSLPTTGKWYWEVTVSSVGEAIIGIQTRSNLAFSGPKTGYYRAGGASNGIYIEGSTNVYAASSYTNGDVIAVAFNADSSQISWYKNNVQQGGPYSLTSIVDLTPILIQGSGTGSNSGDINFGQRPFTYTPPSGFVALNTQNLPTPTISNGATVMAATLWTGDGTNPRTITNTVNGVSFQPDLVWTKARSQVYDHSLYDSVRGATNYLISNSTAAEASAANTLQAFNSNGFQVGGNNYTNSSSATYVGWQWNAGGSTVTNTSGSISSQVRANPTAGFSIVTYTGTGANATVGHGLGVAPKMIIVKNRSAVSSWMIAVDYSGFTWSSDYFQFDTGAKYTNGASTIFRQAPTSTVFSVGTNSNINGSTNNLVAYCFSAVAGYSAFGSYTGNGSADGPFVYLGFRPRWVLFKVSSAAGFDWLLYDSSRNTYNVTNLNLRPDLSDAEGSQTANNLDFLSNGFKIRGDSTGSINPAQTIIYAAFAENPFKNSLAR